MKRKLWLLNFALIAVVAAGGWRLRKEAQDFHARKLATFGTKVPIPAPPPPPPAAPPPAVKAATYLEIADKMLWSKDRNSQVIPDPPKPAEKPKPLPPLPSVYGVMNLDGPIVMMSEKSGARQRGIRPGEKIGEFKLDAVNGEQLVFSWEDRTVTKKLDELIDRGVDSTPVVNASGPAAAASSAPAAPQVVGRPEPGVKLSEGINSCQTNDPAPAGTVVNGMRKVIRQTPFGNSCFWEAVK